MSTEGINPEEEQQVEEAQSQEASQEEELSYEEMFNQEFGDEQPDVEVEVELSEEENTSEPAESAPVQESETSDNNEQAQKQNAAPIDEARFAWIDELPEEVRAEAIRLRNEAKAHQGRAATFQNRASNLQYELDRMKSRSAQTAAQSPDKSLASASAAQELPKEWKQLQEDFPEFASAVEAIRESDRLAFQQQLQEKIEPLENMSRAQDRQRFTNEVSAAAAEIFDTENTGVFWTDVVASDDFRAWLDMQPPSVQQAAVTPDTRDAIYVLQRYEKDYQEAVARMYGQSEQGTDAGNSPKDQPSKADEVRAKRQKQKAASVAPGSKPAPSESSNVSGDYEAQFNAMWG